MITTIAFYSALIFVGAIVIKTIKEEIIDDKKPRQSSGRSWKNRDNLEYFLGAVEDEEKRQKHE